eukprot:TRINITY_DN12430_c0_g1_i1.p1 TRINITY_DN12430_c0_g1~~TRINITY_DN12430_c0_g1_i1.p1  ORF type:complete len:365 (+),score=61.95 TRINITY_DN12430_c0_g1_i1:36-1130(+)
MCIRDSINMRRGGAAGLLNGVHCFWLLLCICVLGAQAAAPILTYPGNTALSFDGKNDLVLISRESTDDSITEFWTVEAWVKLNPIQNKITVPQNNIVGFPRRAPNLEVCGPNHPNPACQMGVTLTQIRDVSGAYFVIYGNTKVNDGQWHHVAATWDNQTLALYIDGNLDASSQPYQRGYVESSKCDDCLNGLQIGGFALPDFRDQFISGIIDEVRVWKIACDQSTIQKNMGKTLGAEYGLLYYFRFDEGIGTLVASSASVAYGTLGAGTTSAEPQWVKSDAPIKPSGVSDGGWSKVNTDVRVGFWMGAILAFVFFALGCLTMIALIKYAPSSPFAQRLFDRHAGTQASDWEKSGLVDDDLVGDI